MTFRSSARASIAAALLTAFVLAACRRQAPVRLVVVIVVDQMRADFVQKFGPEFRHGLAAILRDGAAFTNGSVGYAMSFTSPGHATIATGLYPGHHGVVNNGWWDREAHADVSSSGDARTSIVPIDGLSENWKPEPHGHSPRMLLQETLGDRLKEAFPESKVLSVCIKSRSAVLMGGRAPDGVYWYQKDAGGFISSSFYGDRYPQWLVDFDHELTAGRSVKDLPAWRAPAANNGEPAEVTVPPRDDELSFALAERIVDAEQLGDDASPDLLWISASQGDTIGHREGPDSSALHDYYLEIDGLIGRLLEHLNERVGPEHYAIVLTSDHGVRPLVQELAKSGIEGRNANPSQLDPALAEAVDTVRHQLKIEGQVDHLWVDGVVLDPRNLGQIPPSQLQEFRRRLAAELKRFDFVADAYTYEELTATTGPSRPYLDLYRNSFHVTRGPDVVLRSPPYLLVTTDSHTGHGTVYRYDQHVPIVFLGPGIAAGDRDEPAELVDIAPTVASLLGLSTSGFDGHPLALRTH